MENLTRKLRNDCHDVIALKPISEAASGDHRQTVEVAGPAERPKPRIICAPRSGANRSGKFDIRHVIFQGLPKSINSMVKMVEDAGVDAELGRVTMMLCDEELFTSMNAAAVLFPSVLTIKALLREIFNSRRVMLPHFNGWPAYVLHFTPITFRLQVNRATIFSSIKLLTRAGFLKSHTKMLSRIKYKILREKYTPLQNNAPFRQWAVAKYLLEHRQANTVDLFEMAEDLGGRNLALAGDIFQLEMDGFLELESKEFAWLVTSKKRPSDGEIDSLARTQHGPVRKLQNLVLANRRSLMQLFTSARCMMVSVADHLNVQMPGGRDRCGRCTFCITGQPVVVELPDLENVDLDKVRAIVQAFPEFRHDPRIYVQIACE